MWCDDEFDSKTHFTGEYLIKVHAFRHRSNSFWQPMGEWVKVSNTFVTSTDLMIARIEESPSSMRVRQPKRKNELLAKWIERDNCWIRTTFQSQLMGSPFIQKTVYHIAKSWNCWYCEEYRTPRSCCMVYAIVIYESNENSWFLLVLFVDVVVALESVAHA